MDIHIHDFSDVDSFIEDDFSDEFSPAPYIKWADAPKIGSESVLDSVLSWEYAEFRLKMRMQKILKRRLVKNDLLQLIEKILALNPIQPLIYGENNPMYGFVHSPYTQPTLAIKTAKRWLKWHQKKSEEYLSVENYSDAALHKVKSLQFRNMLMQARITCTSESVKSKLLRGSGKMSPENLRIGAQKSDWGRVMSNITSSSSESKSGYKKVRIRHIKQR